MYKDTADDGLEVESIRRECRYKQEESCDVALDGPFGLNARARGYVEFVPTPESDYTDRLAPRVLGMA